MINIRLRDDKVVRQWLTLVISLLKKSYIGNKKDGILSGLPAIDLMSSESNELSIHCLEHDNDKESFSTTCDSKATKTSVTAQPGYFSLVRM
jgi:hypothetical protein